MPQLQPYVSNVPLQLAKNLRFLDDNNIPVVELLPVGMNGPIVADGPKTGYISRIGALLSDQIDRYTDVTVILNQYRDNIIEIQEDIAELQTSGNTIPNVNGYCFTGNTSAPITTVTDAIAQSLCNYTDVLGSTSNLAQAILAEDASVLNVASAFSIAGGHMQALAGWIPSPQTLADSLNNAWLSYWDIRPAMDKVLASVIPTCSQVIIDFRAIYKVFVPTGSGFFIYFSGYSFIPSGYVDKGSTITIDDGAGNSYTAGIDIVNFSNSGTDSLFVGISGTSLSTSAASYQVKVTAAVRSGSNSCSKVVIHDTAGDNTGNIGSGAYRTGNFRNNGFSGTINLIQNLPWEPTAIVLIPLDASTATVMKDGYYFTISGTSVDLDFVPGSGSGLNLNWIAFK